MTEIQSKDDFQCNSHPPLLTYEPSGMCSKLSATIVMFVLKTQSPEDQTATRNADFFESTVNINYANSKYLCFTKKISEDRN